MIFAQIARTRFLVENGFELLAQDKLQSNVWRSYRQYARGNLLAIVEQALAECSPQRKELLGRIDILAVKG
jgi:hypothetical protein